MTGAPVRARLAASALLTVLAVLTPAGCGADEPDRAAATVVVDDPDGLAGTRLQHPVPVPATTLTATDGEPFSVTDDTSASWTLLFFGYTRCPDVCQLVMSSLASAVTRLPEAEQDRVQVVLVTSDPARDDPQTLRTYLDRFSPDFEGLTGPLPRIVALGKAVGVPVARGPRLPSGGYEVNHGATVVGVDAADESAVVWTDGTSPSQFAEDLHALLGG